MGDLVLVRHVWKGWEEDEGRGTYVELVGTWSRILR